jgi:hypothetical protein
MVWKRFIAGRILGWASKRLDKSPKQGFPGLSKFYRQFVYLFVLLLSRSLFKDKYLILAGMFTTV